MRVCYELARECPSESRVYVRVAKISQLRNLKMLHKTPMRFFLTKASVGKVEILEEVNVCL